MKNFNMTRFGRVLKLDFVEGRKTLMWGTLCMLLLYLFFFWFAHAIGFNWHDVAPEEIKQLRINTICEAVGAFGMMAMCIFFLLAASTLYRGEQKKQQRIAWLMLPASNLEKFVSRWIYMLVFSLVGGLLPFFVADLLHMAYLSMTDYPVMAATDDFFHFFPHVEPIGGAWWGVTSAYTFLLALHAFYLLGGVFFKKFHFIAVSTIVFLLFTAFVTVFNTLQLAGQSGPSSVTAYYAVSITVNVVLIVLFTWLAYWLFCRWQVVTRKFANV